MCTFKAARRRRRQGTKPGAVAKTAGTDKNAAQAKRKAAGRRRRQGTKPGAVAKTAGTDKNAAQAKRKAAGRRRHQGTKPGAVAGKASAYQAAQAKYRFGQIRPKPVN